MFYYEIFFYNTDNVLLREQGLVSTNGYGAAALKVEDHYSQYAIKDIYLYQISNNCLCLLPNSITRAKIEEWNHDSAVS